MASIKNLHLKYRLWIAEMNADISVLRIFDDYLNEIIQKDKGDDTVKNVKHYKEAFLKVRKEMDDLRHEMHLNKMKLAAADKTNKVSVKEMEKNICHDEIEERYKDFRKRFKAMKKEFQQLEIA